MFKWLINLFTSAAASTQEEEVSNQDRKPWVEEPWPVEPVTTNQTTFPEQVEELVSSEQASTIEVETPAPKPKKKRYYKPKPKKPVDGLQASPEPAKQVTRNRRGPEAR